MLNDLQLEVERLHATMVVLEDYVDSLLAAEEAPAMDSWIDDVDLELRVVSL
ncbi:MAG: hypothetical protein QOE92_616 [Chloroflexota bacterium]|jgi:hypothetical protein|nr:hypothetical protein [Chloroflexota bacterium]